LRIEDMQQVLSNDLWTTVGRYARQARRKKAAIAYVTKDLVGLKSGDTLVVNASKSAVQTGETDANLLRSFLRKGVNLYNSECLHSKVLLLGDVAVISSANMSGSSGRLVEVGFMTDHTTAVAGVASFIEQLQLQSARLGAEEIAGLCKIKVIRRGGPGFPRGNQRKPKVTQLGNRTWLVGVRELVKSPPPDEQRFIDRATNKLRRITGNPEEEPDWIRWTGVSRFRRECREGDSLIQIWRSSRARTPSKVIRNAPVLLKQDTESWTRFYVGEPLGRRTETSWNKFRRLLKAVGETRTVNPGSVLLLDSDVADAITRRWRLAV
jgi:hypothetical protein